jgi:hypothetical protein
MTAKKEHLAVVIATLARHSQRATYGAVGGVVVLPAQSVMQGEAKNHRNSWVVSAKNGEPSGYSKEDWAPLLKTNPEVIHSPIALAAWLKAHS